MLNRYFYAEWYSNILFVWIVFVRFLSVVIRSIYATNVFTVINYNLAIKIFRLWAEVFHVSASGAGTVKWQQVSEDLVPVNITCIQDSPECIFHITAYNSQVDKILDVRLVQPGKIITWYRMKDDRQKCNLLKDN